MLQRAGKDGGWVDGLGRWEGWWMEGWMGAVGWWVGGEAFVFSMQVGLGPGPRRKVVIWSVFEQ